MDAVESFMEVVGQGVGGGDDVVTGLDFDRVIAAGGPDELPARTRQRACAATNPVA